MSRVVTMAVKDLKILFRDKFGLFWIFAFPLLFAIFFGSIFGGKGEGGSAMSVAIVDEARNDASRRFIARLDESKSIEVTRDEKGEVVLYDPERAMNLVRRGDRVAFVRLLPGFEGASLQMFGQAGEKQLQVGIDPARQAEAGYLRGILMETTFSGFTEQFRDRDRMKKQIDASIADLEKATGIDPGQQSVVTTFLRSLQTFTDEVDVDQMEENTSLNAGDLVETVEVARDASGRPRSAFDVMFPSAILWGIIGCLAGFSIAIVRERVGGTLLRLRVAPITRTQLLAGKALSCFLACCIVSVFLIAFGHVVFGVRIGSPFHVALAIAATGICFTGIMMTVSLMGKTEQAVAGAGWGIMMPLAMLGGGMVPLIAMPTWMLKLSSLSPVKWGIVAIEGGVWRDFALSEMALPCGILVAVGVMFFGIGVFVFTRAEG